MSGINVVCQCGQQFMADADRAGQVLNCPVCQRPIQVPLQSPAPQTQPVQLQPIQLQPIQQPGAPHAAGHPAPQQPVAHPVPAPGQHPETPQPTAPGAPAEPQKGSLPYEPQTTSVVLKVLFVFLLLAAFFCSMTLLLVDGVVSMVGGNTAAVGRLFGLFLLVMVGLFALSASLLEWRWFFNLGKGLGMRALMGDVGARFFYIAIGCVAVLIPFIVSGASIVSSFSNSDAVATTDTTTNETASTQRRPRSNTNNPRTNPRTSTNRTNTNTTSPAPSNAQKRVGPPKVDPYQSANLTLDPAPKTLPAGAFQLMSGHDRHIVVISRAGSRGSVPITLFDLVTEKEIVTADIKDRATVQSVSAQGTRFAYTRWGSKVVIEVRNCSAPDAVEATIELKDANSLSLAYFEDDTHLVTSTSDNVLRRYELPSAKLVNEQADAHAFGLTPGGNYLLESEIGFVHFRDAKTWKRVGSLAFDDQPIDARTIGISKDGRYLAVYGRGSGPANGNVSVWDLSSESKVFTAAVPTAHVPKLQWLSDEYLVCADSVVSVSKRAYVAKVPQLRNARLGPDHQHWLSQFVAGRTVIWPSDLESSPLGAELAQATPLAKSVLQPGDAISVSVSFRASPPNAGTRSEFQDVFDSVVKRSGLTVGTNRPIKLNVVVADTPQGGSVEFQEYIETESNSPFGRKDQRITNTHSVPENSLSATYSLVAGGKTLWETTRKYKTSDLLNYETRIDPNVTITPQYILNQRWDRLLSSVRSVTVPNQFSEIADAEPKDMANSLDPAVVAKVTSQAAFDRIPKIDLRPPVDRNWNAPPDEAAAFETPLATGLLRLGECTVDGIAFSSQQVGQAVVQLTETDGEKSMFYRCDLRAKKVLAKTPSPSSKLLDFRPDGRVYLITLVDRSLEVWKCGTETDEPFLQVQNPTNAKYTGAYFVGSKGLLTEADGQLQMRMLPKGDVVFERSLEIGGCYLSWNRKYLLDWEGERLCLIDVANGEVAGELAPIPKSISTSSFRRNERPKILSAAFHPNGKVLIAILDRSSGFSRELVMWNLTDGSLLTTFFGYDVKPPMRWVSPVHVLCDKRLVNTQTELVSWNYGSSIADDTSCGLGYYVTADDRNRTHLAAIGVPSQFVISAVKAAHEKKSLVPEKEIDIKVTLPAAHPRASKLMTELEKALTTCVEAQGRTVGVGEPTLLSVEVTEIDNKNMFRVVQGEAETFVPNKELRAKITLGSAQGSSFWTRYIQVQLSDFPFQIPTDSTDIVADLLTQQEEELVRRVAKVQVPMTKQPRLHFRGFGTSKLGPTGEIVEMDFRYR